MDHTKAEAAIKAHKHFEDERQCWVVAGKAAKLGDRDALNAAFGSNHERLLRAEERAVTFHREAYGRPPRSEVLHAACKSAGMQPPRSFDEGDVAAWEDETIRSVPLHVRERGAELVRAARRHAREDRLFTAEYDLRGLLTLIKESSDSDA
jgi:hypothetical protein